MAGCRGPQSAASAVIFQPFAPIHNSTFRLELKTSMTRLLIRNGFLQALPSFEPANQNHKRESQSENLKSLFSCRGLFGSSAPALLGGRCSAERLLFRDLEFWYCRDLLWALTFGPDEEMLAVALHSSIFRYSAARQGFLPFRNPSLRRPSFPFS